MPLPETGPLTLDQIHVEAGGASQTAASINDQDIRELLYPAKTAATAMSFNEWYGAAGNLSTTANFRNISTKWFGQAYDFTGSNWTYPQISTGTGHVRVRNQAYSRSYFVDHWYFHLVDNSYLVGKGGTTQRFRISGSIIKDPFYDIVATYWGQGAMYLGTMTTIGSNSWDSLKAESDAGAYFGTSFSSYGRSAISNEQQFYTLQFTAVEQFFDTTVDIYVSSTSQTNLVLLFWSNNRDGNNNLIWRLFDDIKIQPLGAV